MRPGFLAGLDGFWFGNLSGRYFELRAARSADPFFTLRGRIRGKTADEFKALDYRDNHSSTLVPSFPTGHSYQESPYWNSFKQDKMNQLIKDHKERTQIFKLIS